MFWPLCNVAIFWFGCVVLAWMGRLRFKYFSNLIFLQFHAKQDLSGGCIFPLTQWVSFLRPNSLIGLVYLPSIANLARVRQPAMIELGKILWVYYALHAWVLAFTPQGHSTIFLLLPTTDYPYSEVNLSLTLHIYYIIFIIYCQQE